MTVAPNSIDEYLENLPAEKRDALQRLREIIRKTAADAVECISYRQPAFRLGKLLVGFGATKNHCAFYLLSSTVLDQFKKEISGLDASKGTIRFLPGNPLPEKLVQDLVKARMKENAR